MPLTSVGGKFELYLISTYLLQLLVADYLREININFYHSLIFICTLAAFKLSSKKKETEIGKEMVEVFKYASNHSNKVGIKKSG